MMKVLLNRDVWIIANLIITYMGFQVEKRVLLDYKSEDIRADHNIYTYRPTCNNVYTLEAY